MLLAIDSRPPTAALTLPLLEGVSHTAFEAAQRHRERERQRDGQIGREREREIWRPVLHNETLKPRREESTRCSLTRLLQTVNRPLQEVTNTAAAPSDRDRER